MLLAGKSVYILDDFEEAADKTVCEIILTGKEITKFEYEKY